MNKIFSLPLIFLMFILPSNSRAQTFTWTGNLPVLDFQTTAVPIAVSGLQNTIDTTFGLAHICMDITHTYDGDLTIRLVSPVGDTVLLIQNTGGGGDNFWGTCVGVDGTLFSNSTAPYSGIFRPVGNTAAFNNGQNPNGTWWLLVSDMANADTGSIHHASIVFTYNPPQFSGGSGGVITGTYVCPSCVCPGAAATCNLLPDMTASAQEIQNNHLETPGALYLSNATPNIGFGPLEIYAVDTCFCDSTQVPCNTTCTSGDIKQLIKQRIYIKLPGTDTLTYYDRSAGTMTYHEHHGHLHVDNFANFSLRTPTSNPDATTWPIIGTSVKQSFCLINLGTCAGNPGICRDTLGNTLTSFPNQNLGFHTGCGLTQGIYVGNYDVYSMSLNDPILLNNVCNGTYYIVSITDPDDNFLESNETNNWVAVPITLTQQNAVPVITAQGPVNLCLGDSVILTANMASHYLWSTGDTTQSIVVNQAGVYTVSTNCGTSVATSAPVTVTVSSPGVQPLITIAQTQGTNPACPGTSITYTASIVHGGSNPAYQWWVNGQTTGSNQSTFSSSSLAPGDSIYCTLTSSLPCISNNQATSNVLYRSSSTLLCYCTPIYGTTANSGCLDGDVIYRVVLNTLDHTSGSACPSGIAGYADYTSSGMPNHTTSLNAGSTYTITLYAGQYGQGYKVWLDMNLDGLFSAGEVLAFTSGVVAGSGVIGQVGASASLPFTLPCTLAPGSYRLRIRCLYNTSGTSIQPCIYQNNYGEVEDYTVTILPPNACPAPIQLQAQVLSQQSATLQWSPGCTETSWDVYLALAGTGLPNTPTHPGLSNTQLTVNGLQPATSYLYWVRANCATASSNWAGPIPFTTQSICSTVPGTSMSVPIDIGPIPCASLHNQQQQTNTTQNCFSNSYSGAFNQASPDIWYRFTLLQAATVEINTCTSAFDTYIHLLSSTGAHLVSNDDNGPLCSGLRASLSQALNPGVYYVVCEGYGTNTGQIITRFRTQDTCASFTNLQLEAFIQGYVQGSSMAPVLANQGVSVPLGACDTVQVELHDTLAPFSLAYSLKGLLYQDGSLQLNFPSLWGSYYIVMNHRNALETWSAQPIGFYGQPVQYSFSATASQAYGQNLVQLPNGGWGLYSGDLNRDQNIDLLDMSLLEVDILDFLQGWIPTDLNGDGNADLLDSPILEFNIGQFVFTEHP